MNIKSLFVIMTILVGFGISVGHATQPPDVTDKFSAKKVNPKPKPEKGCGPCNPYGVCC